MKFNQWTLGLAAVGVISLASAARADESASPINTMVAGTMIDGYVDTSMQWNFGTGNEYLPPYKFGGPAKADGFNLNVVQLSISKPLDESEWGSGYKVDLWFGPDANALGTTSGAGWQEHTTDFAIRQAYVALRAPVGNGLDFKVGVFDSIVGYESVESGNNPNMTRSYGHGLEPQTMTGVLATYRFCDCFSAAVGVANTVGPMINQRAFAHTGTADGTYAESFKTYMASIALTAPQSWGWAAGSTLYAGVVNGFNESENYAGNASNIEEVTTSWYVGGTLATPVTGLKLGAAFDYLKVNGDSSYYDHGHDYAWAVAGYGSYQATEKLSLHLRADYLKDHMYFLYDVTDGNPAFDFDNTEVFALTATVQYDLWKNVISRVEFRWDHDLSDEDTHTDGVARFGRDGNLKNAFMLAANIIYKF